MTWLRPDADVSPTLAVVCGSLFMLMLLAGAWQDVRTRRISNTLNGVLLGLGVLAGAFGVTPAEGAPGALLGAAAGLGIWLGFYALGVMGAGDVKFFAAIAAWLGPSLTWRAALLTALLGGVLAVAFLLRDARFVKAIRTMALAVATRSASVVRVDTLTPEQARRQLPYGVPMALGAAVAFWFPHLVGG